MGKQVNILLVDDEQDFLAPIAFWLESKGYSVRIAPNGKEALDLIEEEVPDIIFLDVNMPVMDGLEALERLRKIHKDLPVIMITANADQLTRSNELGISGFFPKEGTLQNLERLLEPILRTHKNLDIPSEQFPFKPEKQRE